MNLPIEIIYYIYEFDPTYKENMNKVLTQLKSIFESYNEEYSYNKAMLRRLVYKGRFYDNNCYFNWVQKYGYEHNPIKYVLANSVKVYKTNIY